MAERAVYTLTVEDIARPDDAPAEQRLRLLLKAIRRAYGFRCRRVVEGGTPPAGQEPPAQSKEEPR